jgi:hypothetical protein
MSVVVKNRAQATSAKAAMYPPDSGGWWSGPGEDQDVTLSVRRGSFQPGRMKWHVYPLG